MRYFVNYHHNNLAGGCHSRFQMFISLKVMWVRALGWYGWQRTMCTFRHLSKSQGGWTSGQFQTAVSMTDQYFQMQCAQLAGKVFLLFFSLLVFKLPWKRLLFNSMLPKLKLENTGFMDSKFQNYRCRFFNCVIYGCKVIVTGET